MLLGSEYKKYIISNMGKVRLWLIGGISKCITKNQQGNNRLVKWTKEMFKAKYWIVKIGIVKLIPRQK